MSKSCLVNRYNDLNNSFKKILVFRIGEEAGFFSEYNNMILALIYCLTNRIQFKLYSQDANFSYRKDISDYFDPFCNHVSNNFHKMYNHRYGNITPLPFFYKVSKKLGLTNLLTQDVFDKIRKQKLDESYTVKELDIQGNLLHACFKLVNLTWRFNSKIKREIVSLKKKISIKGDYIGFHIRGGDKFKEAKLFDGSNYIEYAEKISRIRIGFILTDDYRIFQSLSVKYPYWTFYTLCAIQENGYFLERLMKQDKASLKDAHVRLFASVEILKASKYFIGTFTSNPGMFLGMLRGGVNCFGIDQYNWSII